VNEASVIGERAIRADEGLACDSCPIGFDLEHVLDDLFGVFVQFGVDEGDVVVASNDISEGAEPFFDSLNFDGVGETVSKDLKFHVGGHHGDDQSVLVGGDKSADSLGVSDRGVHHGHVDSELFLEDRVEVLGPTRSDQAVGVGEFGEASNFIGVFKVASICHVFLI